MAGKAAKKPQADLVPIEGDEAPAADLDDAVEAPEAGAVEAQAGADSGAASTGQDVGPEAAAPVASAGFVVAWGCIQEAGEIYVEGDPYQPPTPEIEEDLLGQGIIKRAGAVEE